MAIDYARMSQVAQKLISANGRTITLIKLAASDNIEMPWKNATPAPVATQVDKAAVVASSDTLLGAKLVPDDLLNRVNCVAWGACNGLDIAQGDFDIIVDEGKQYSIEFLQQLKPATTPLIFYVGYNK